MFGADYIVTFSIAMALLFFAAASLIAWEERIGIPSGSIHLDWVSKRNSEEKAARLKNVVKFLASFLVAMGVLLFAGELVVKLYLVACVIACGVLLMKRCVRMLDLSWNLSRRQHFAVTAIGIGAVAAITAAWMFFPNWMTFDVAASVTAVWLIVKVRIDNFATGVILSAILMGLDVVLVFGSHVMIAFIHAAHGIPVLLIEPASLSLHPRLRFAFGFGDIFSSGLFVMLAFRMAKLYRSNAIVYGTVCGFTAGLILVLNALDLFHSPQPATIYLLPCTACGYMLVALASGRREAIEGNVRSSASAAL